MSDSLRALIAAALGDMAQTFGQTGALLARRPSDDMLFAQADAALAAIEASGTHVVVPVEPTEEMADAGESSLICGPLPQDIATSPGMTWAAAKSCYRDMLAERPRDAAPTDKEAPACQVCGKPLWDEEEMKKLDAADSATDKEV